MKLLALVVAFAVYEAFSLGCSTFELRLEVECEALTTAGLIYPMPSFI